MKSIHWTDFGALAFLILITVQLLTLIFWPSIIIIEDNKSLVIIEFLCMIIFDLLFLRNAIKKNTADGTIRKRYKL